MSRDTAALPVLSAADALVKLSGSYGAVYLMSSRVNERAKAADQDPKFSEKIRTGLPGMKPVK